MPGTIFISYSRHDTRHAERLHNWVSNELGLPAFYDKKTIKDGHAWRTLIKHWLDTSVVILVLVSKKSMESHNVTFEWSYALGRGIQPISLVIDSELTNNEVNQFLTDFQYRNFIEPSDEDYDTLATRLQELYVLANVPDEVQQAVVLARSPIRNNQEQAINLLEEYPDDSALRELRIIAQNNTLQNRQISAALALARKTKNKDEIAIDGLIRAVENRTYQKYPEALRCLRDLNSVAAANALYKTLDQVENLIKKEIIEILLRMSTENLSEIFADLVQRKTLPLRFEMLQHLHENKHPETPTLIINYLGQLQQSSEQVYKLYKMLSEYTNDDVVEQLLKGVLNHGSAQYVWERQIVDSITEGLANNASEDVIERLRKLQRHGINQYLYNSLLAKVRTRLKENNE